MLRCSVRECDESEDFDHNIVGVQTCLSLSDYSSEGGLERKLVSYLAEVERAGWLRQSTVVVLPELIGAWLLISDVPALARRARRLGIAMTSLALSRPIRFFSALIGGRGKDRAKDAVFRMRSADLAARYHHLFSRLASKFRVTLVAGSVILPDPIVRAGCIEVRDGPLRNVTVVYRPDGTPHEKLVFKVHPIAEEVSFIEGGRLDDLPVFDTPAGKLGVLICADSWYPECYEVLENRGAESLAVPGFLIPDGAWSRRWPGYSGRHAPPDVEPGDQWRLTEREAWLKYAMGGRLVASSLARGITVFGRGRLWDMGSDGSSFAIAGERLTSIPNESVTGLLNLAWSED